MHPTVHALFVYPGFPSNTFWGFREALRFVGKKASMPPIGLLTVAKMFPDHYDLRLVDMNVGELTREHLEWADIVFTSTMVVQQDSLRGVVRRCNEAKVPVVAGGPHPTSFHDEMDKWPDARVDYYVLGEVEDTLPQFFQAWEAGTAERFMRAPSVGAVSVADTPVPRFDLLSLWAYDSMAIQFSRGCPFNCEFCDITKLFGQVSRTKSNKQIIDELELLYKLGWRGSVFVVDDNFIGNKRDVMRLLPALVEWQEEHEYPFSFFTEASVNLSNMPELMDLMVQAGFNMVFLGIETPNPKALIKTQKGQNVRRGQDNYLLEVVREIQHRGMHVTAGFILGLDGDTEDAFSAQIEFIQEAGIPQAMVGLLTALKGTDLYFRLQREGRLRDESTGNNVDMALNFVPEMDEDVLIAGYERVLLELYGPTLRSYFQRCLTFFDHFHPISHSSKRVDWIQIRAFLRSLLKQGFSRQGLQYFSFLIRVLYRYPHMFADAVQLAIKGYHFEKVTSQVVVTHAFRKYLEQELKHFREFALQVRESQEWHLQDLRDNADRLRVKAERRYRRMRASYRLSVRDAFLTFQEAIEACVEGRLEA